jgi:phosphoglycolate phosphatase
MKFGNMAAKSFDLIVFDWDGTLMDSAAAIVESLIAACIDLGVAPPTEERARHIIGLGLEDALKCALPDLEPRRYDELARQYRTHYLAQDHQLTLFDGVAAIVAGLAARGHQLAIATGKSRVGLNRALEVSGIGMYFHASRCADECRSKPHPQMLEELMESASVERQRTLMIGDTTHDLQMARNAGVASLAVTYGAHQRAGLEAENPLFCAASVGELDSWLLTNG